LSQQEKKKISTKLMGNWFCCRKNKRCLIDFPIFPNLPPTQRLVESVKVNHENNENIETIETKEIHDIPEIAKDITEEDKKTFKNTRKKQQLLGLQSHTLDCSECSSDYESSSDDEFTLTENIFLDTNATENIYFDISNMKIKLNAEDAELRDISSHILQRYQYFCQTHKTLVCSVDTVLAGLDLPIDATHMVVSFVNYHGDKFYIPFSLDHPNDPFPFEDPELIISGCHDEDLPETIMLIEKDRETNLTETMLYFSRDFFAAGFHSFRPWAWTWLCELSKDPEAILLLTTKHSHCIEYTSVSLYDPQLNTWQIETE